MSRFLRITSLLTVLLIVPHAKSLAGEKGHVCQECRHACHGYELVECTIMEPAWVIENRTETFVIKSTEDREETYTVFKKVPVTREFHKEICYLEDEVKTKTITEEICHLVKVPVEQTCKVKVPYREMREIMVPQKPCSCLGHNKCQGCNLVPQMCEVVVEHEEEHITTYCAVELAFETTKCDISYCVKVPKTRKELCCTESSFKFVPEERTRTVQVCVPKLEKRVVEVPVRKMMPRTIVCCSKCAHRHNGSKSTGLKWNFFGKK